jgi:hypothetical protein
MRSPERGENRTVSGDLEFPASFGTRKRKRVEFFELVKDPYGQPA